MPPATDQRSIRLRLPNDLYLRLLARAKDEEVSLNTLMISMLGSELGEGQKYRRKQLKDIVIAADLEARLGDAVRSWDGRELRLYKIVGGVSATFSAAQRIARENAEQEPWGVVIGSRSFLLARNEGHRLELALEARRISYIRHRGRGRPADDPVQSD